MTTYQQESKCKQGSSGPVLTRTPTVYSPSLSLNYFLRLEITNFFPVLNPVNFPRISLCKIRLFQIVHVLHPGKDQIKPHTLIHTHTQYTIYLCVQCIHSSISIYSVLTPQTMIHQFTTLLCQNADDYFDVINQRNDISSLHMSLFTNSLGRYPRKGSLWSLNVDEILHFMNIDKILMKSKG